MISGEVAAARKSEIASLPVTWTFGAKTRHQRQTFEDDSLAWRTDLIGLALFGYVMAATALTRNPKAA